MKGEPIRAAVLSDTHGLLRPEVERVLQTCDVIIHAGDFDNQMLYHKLEIRQPLYAVRGNNDGFWAEGLPLVRRFDLGGVRFIMTHDRYDFPKDLGKAQIVIFGHSHMLYNQEEDGRLWLNPGSCGYKRFTLPLSMAVITIQDGAYELETIWLDSVGAEYGATFREKRSVKEKFERFAGRVLPDRLRDQTDDHEGPEGESNRKKQEKDRLFLIAKITRFMNRGETAEWVAANLKTDLVFVEDVFRIYVTHPGINAHQILDKLELKNR